MNKCPNCKAEFLIDHSFCPECAFDLRIKRKGKLSEVSKVSKEELENREVLELTPPPLPESDIQTEDNLTKKKPQKQGMFSNPFSFEGRIRRTEYGISLIIFFLIAIALQIILELDLVSTSLFNLLRIIPSWFIIAQGAKRCHDLEKNGLWQIIPFYVFWLMFARGDDFMNKYGLRPKG